MDVSRLKGKIIEKYGSEKIFASEIGIKYSSLNARLQGKKEFDLELIDRIVKKLQITPEEILKIFFDK